MPNIALIKYYAYLVSKDRMSVDNLLPSIKDDVLRCLRGEPIVKQYQETNPQIVNEDTNDKMPAPTMPIRYLHIGKEVTAIRCPNRMFELYVKLNLNDIFSRGELDDLPRPVNTNCKIAYIENTARVFHDIQNSVVRKTGTQDNMFMIEMISPGIRRDTGYPLNLFRIDLVITSDNYEDMRLTVYIRR